jgi:hypothetical protein
MMKEAGLKKKCFLTAARGRYVTTIMISPHLLFRQMAVAKPSGTMKCAAFVS